MTLPPEVLRAFPLTRQRVPAQKGPNPPGWEIRAATEMGAPGSPEIPNRGESH